MIDFKAYFEPIFLCNCEIWTITSSQAKNTTNVFQRRLLRTYALNVKWSKKWRGMQKNKSYRMEHHYQKKMVEMVWENNQSRRFNKCKEGI